MILTVYDLSGIQKFIYSTGKLMEVVGASYIVHTIFSERLQELVDPEKSDKLSLQKNEIIYIGGGNALVFFKNEDEMMRTTREMEKYIIEKTRGTLRLCYASIRLEEYQEEASFQTLYHDLMEALATFKNQPNEVVLKNGFAIGEYDTDTLAPLVLWGKDKNIYGDSSRLEKNKAYHEGKENKDEDGRFYTRQFEDFREKEEDRKSFIAVVHIDGDSSGQQILDYVYAMKSENLKESLRMLRLLSERITRIYTAVLKETVREVFREYKRGTILPFRPIISDGDDVTFLIEAEKAFDFTEVFMKKLQDIAMEEETMEKGIRISASAGLVFVHDKFPFNRAYQMAEDLCELIKKQKKGFPESLSRKHTSAMDFHIVRSDLDTTIEDFRELNYILEDRSIFLQLRPYFYDEMKRQGYQEKDDADYENLDLQSYLSFKILRQKIKEKEELYRNKLKGLRNAYGKGYSEAENFYANFLRKNGREFLGIQAEKPFYGKKKTALFFDVLDAMDF